MREICMAREGCPRLAWLPRYQVKGSQSPRGIVIEYIGWIASLKTGEYPRLILCARCGVAVGWGGEEEEKEGQVKRGKRLVPR